jgi:hypothetical protein
MSALADRKREDWRAVAYFFFLSELEVTLRSAGDWKERGEEEGKKREE